jgi:iron complex transport system ATP-binding protein
MMRPLLKLQDGSFCYGDKDIFSGLNLAVNRGELLCVLGSNGCGKTTLLKCLTGSLKLGRGHVFLKDNDIHSMNSIEIARSMGFVFQEHSPPFPFSVMEVVQMGRAPHLRLFASPSPRDKAVAEKVLEKVGMLHLSKKPYTQISGGERQLVLIARTLAQEPEVILLDEPTSHLDFKNQTLVLRMIKKLAQNGLAVLMTSHLPDHALLFSSRVALMKSGRFLSVGKPEEVMTEESLKETYGIQVNLATVTDPGNGKTLKLVIPAREPVEVPEIH